ncbi:MAG: YqcC family protein [Thiohalocapsa sp.]|nr:YqcC family protein [Thiohalocapsa sp.]
MMPAETDVAALLDALQAELERVDQWEPAPPPQQALSSPLPFAVDTLRFTQWLQWIFLPRTRALLDAHGRLPLKSAILPMAEEALADTDWDASQLLVLIGRIDRAMNRI